MKGQHRDKSFRRGDLFGRAMQHRQVPLVIILAAIPRVLGADIFNANCTLPPEGVNYVSGPNVRSTLTIVWNSLATIFLCTWTVQHLNIPDPKQASGLPALWRKLKWMFVMIIAPEFMVGKALGDWVAASASESCPVMKLKAEEAKSKWTITHAFYANMGGFLVHKRECFQLNDETRSNASLNLENPRPNQSTECSCEASSVHMTDEGHCATEFDHTKPSLGERLKTRLLHREQGGRPPLARKAPFWGPL